MLRGHIHSTTTIEVDRRFKHGKETIYPQTNVVWSSSLDDSNSDSDSDNNINKQQIVVRDNLCIKVVTGREK